MVKFARMFPTRGFTAGDAVSSRPPWWMLALAAAFAGYYSLLLYSDLRRPEPIGFISQVAESGVFLHAVAKDSPAARAGLKVGDRIIVADGHPIRDRLDWLLFETNLQTGRPLHLEIDRDGNRQPATLVLDRASWFYWATMPGATLLSARTVQFVTLLLAIVVAFKRPLDTSARIGSWMLATLAVYSIVLPYQIAATWRSLPLIVGAALWIPFASSMAIAAVLFSFFALFPRPIVRSRWAWFALWVPTAVLLFLQLDFAVRAVYRPASTSRFVDWTIANVVVMTSYTLAAAVALVIGYQRLTDVTDRRRVRVLVIGSLVGLLSVMSVVGFYWWPSNASLEDSVFASPLAAVSVILGLALPISFAHAILRRRLFDVRFIIRRGLQYALARRGLVSIVPVTAAVFLIDLWINRDVPFATILQGRGWGYGALAGLAVIGRVRRDRWLDALDRRFFREHYNAQRLLRAVGADVRAATNLEVVAPRIVAQIEAAIHPEWVALVARFPQDTVRLPPPPRLGRSAEAFREGGKPDTTYDTQVYRAIAVAPPDIHLEPLPATSRLIALLRLLQKPIRVAADDWAWLTRHLPNDEIEALQRARIELIVPVQLGDGSTGRAGAFGAPSAARIRRGPQRGNRAGVAIPEAFANQTMDALFALGPKRSEEPYSTEDEDLLMAIGENLVGLLAREPVVPQAEDQFEECPECGACYDADAGRCPHDGADLIVTSIPRLLAGRYRLEQRIGRGGMGTVYAAYDAALERKVAAKLLREDLVDGPHAAGRFQSEARLAAALAHPNVVTIHDIGVTRSGRAFFVMELLAGITLREELQRHGRLQPARALHLLRGICAAVTAAHQRQMIHRDLKPDNIVLCRHQSVETPKVLDFGLAKALEASVSGGQTRPGLVAGTPEYMAPEHLRGGEPSPDWDLWAVSVIAFEMITGALPHAILVRLQPDQVRLKADPTIVPEPDRDLPIGLLELFERALSVNPIDRPTSAEEFLNELARVLCRDVRIPIES
jgi:eukaryotic-like serine/threonine-protein kinase